tara:strand:+ start:17265 stop:19580 length:2316 start_codon:yes stop_codon:yes gene_type:complete
MPSLVILESPSKENKVKEILGKGYIVRASYGHVRDLDAKNLSIDIDNNFKPTYIVSSDKKKVVSSLKEISTACEYVYLASDLDREGESIAWHLSKALNLKSEKIRRIRFSEITKKAITTAVKNYDSINMPLFHAQQARRIIDRLLGYKITPILWKEIQNTATKDKSLSAGRVQSVVSKLIIDREKEIEKHNSQLYLKTTGSFNTKKGDIYGELDHNFTNEEEVNDFYNVCKEAIFKIEKVNMKRSYRNPSAPFITSTLQQECSNKWKMSPKQTMMVAQKLYECGLITYMRTDSVTLSDDAVKMISEHITNIYGDEYLNIKQYKNKSQNTQEAHEAIRPCVISTTSIDEDDCYDENEKRLYKLIWKRTIASQMSTCKVNLITTIINLNNSDYKFICKGEKIIFDGFTRVYKEYSETEEDNSKNIIVSKFGDVINKDTITTNFKYTRPPIARFTEASLVKELEKKGIGRPSTYSSMTSVVQTRGYSEKKTIEGTEKLVPQLILESDNKLTRFEKKIKCGADKDKLFPTNVGIIVNKFLEDNFPKLLDVKLTADIESSLDKIAANELNWITMLNTFYSLFSGKIESFNKNELKFKDNYSRVLGSDSNGREISVYIAKYGPVVCLKDTNSKYSPVPKIPPKYAPIKDIDPKKITLKQALELLEYPKNIGVYKNEDVILQKGKYGIYIKYKGKNFSTNNEPIVDFNDAVEIIERANTSQNSNIIKKINNSIIIKNGQYGPYIRYRNKVNVKIYGDKKPEDLTLEDCKKMIARKCKN